MMKRMCVMFHQDSESLFTKEDLLRRYHAAGVSVKPRTVSRYLIYFRDKEIIEFLRDEKGNELYRCKDTMKALAYIEGRFEEYAGQVAPRRPPIRPEGTIHHRPAHKIVLEGQELEKAKLVGIWRKKGKPPGYYHVITKGFNMKVWTSGRAHVFLVGDWRADMMKLFGPTLVQKVDREKLEGRGHEGVAIPTKDRLPREWQDHLPVRAIARVYSDSGLMTTIRYGYSQDPEGELDRHGPVNEPNANQVESWLESELFFKADVRNLFTSLNDKLAELTEAQGKMADLIGKAVGEAVTKALKEYSNPPAPEYKKNDKEKKEDDSLMYG